MINLADLTFQICTRYLDTFKKSVRKRSQGDAKDKTLAIHLSTSVYDSATLTHLYTKCGLNKHEVSKDLCDKLKVYKVGSRRTSARE